MKILKSIYKNEIEIKEISIFKAIITMAIFIIAPMIINLISTYIILIIDIDMSLGKVMSIGSIITILASILLVAVIGRVFTIKDSIKINNSKVSVTKKDFFYVLLIIVGYMLVRNALLLETLSQFEGPITDEDVNIILNNSSMWEVTILGVIFLIQIVIQAPILEELLFRGIILNGLLNKYRYNHKKAIIYSAIGFAVVHMNIPQGINAFIAGIILGGIYYYTGSLKLSIFAHFINNFFMFTPIPDNLITKSIYVVIGTYLIIKGIKYIKLNRKHNIKK